MRTVPANWNAKDIPSQIGKTVVVTGANSGIGYHTALELGRAGARVYVACRDAKRGDEALARLRSDAPGADFRLELLDLADLASVRAFAQRFLANEPVIDTLVNNAGVMAIPTRELTADGFERQFGTNHLGHFALTGLLLPALEKARAPRVVTVSSGLAAIGRVDFDNLQSEKRYGPSRTYGFSKLANLLFMFELGRRAPWLTSVASHPGATHSNLQRHGGAATSLAMKLMGQEAPDGALPSLYGAVGDAQTGDYFGPSRLFNMNGPPVAVKPPRRALDVDTQRTLWDTSEQLTGVRYAFPVASQERRSA